ncbi:response regulator transcription factor [Priestia koreensis]|uniref:response regulator transcription factor n=1 Tax=Priestia koreensis TaxID=284581 RepID=UPI00345B4359
MKKSILIIEDDYMISELLKFYLVRENFDVHVAENGKKGIELFLQVEPCLIILDLMMPYLTGEEVCKIIRDDYKNNVPIIMISAKANEHERIQGLKMGADDYITKPFSPAEVVARVEAVLRRSQTECQKITIGDITLKPIKKEVYRRTEQTLVTNHEFSLLYCLMKEPGHIFTREQLLNALYPTHEKDVNDRTIDVHIKNLREKIEEDPTQPFYIKTVRGIGYAFVTPA